MNSKYHNVQVQIKEQPSPNKHRFRYETEGRGTAGWLSGASNRKTSPTIEILGYKGPAKVLVSCVTDEAPYKAQCYHFYYIVTQEKKVQSMIFFISQLLGHIF